MASEVGGALPELPAEGPAAAKSIRTGWRGSRRFSKQGRGMSLGLIDFHKHPLGIDVKIRHKSLRKVSENINENEEVIREAEKKKQHDTLTPVWKFTKHMLNL
ncbi:hypothetical protein Salat_1554100 [Sesamum alatum]|uniref:Uncharacterized protein n=1 Tax=Sesamum alatum TaxID=300844 RepID=A0AAE2CMP4_9LAMI|nr:hypothetical protein Salat_1554100 [Sesamum alatum]